MVKYEWTIETYDAFGDIDDSEFWDDKPTESLAENQKLALVRNEGSENAGVELRHWAYVVDGKLPECFENENGQVTGYKVPLKYRQ